MTASARYLRDEVRLDGVELGECELELLLVGYLGKSFSEYVVS
jgi:hypothetical protein